MLKIKEKLEIIRTGLLQPINRTAIILLGIYTTVWGFWVANPWWTVFTQAPLYHVLGMLAPEVFWGCLAIVVGLITIYGALKRTYRPLIVGASTVGWHWAMIAIFYFWGDWMNTGGITALLLAVYAAFIYLNIRVNHHKNKRLMSEILH